MERAMKSSKKVPNGEQNVDRLSALPDSVICHILSFLPAQRSVQTSILAKRWRFLWAHVPVLDFDCKYVSSKSTRFPGIVNMFMLRHKVQSLNNFRLTYDGNDGPCYELETCIATVVERNVQNLFLDLRVEVPRCLLTCKTLDVLTMCRGVSITPTAHISLPNLKKLHLLRLKCEVDFTRLLSGTPVLEELIIDRATCRDPRGCYISSATLKRLTIKYLLYSPMFDNPGYMVTINTPALRYLKVDDHSSKHFSISLCTSLVEADIFIDSLYVPDDFNHHCVVELLDSIRNVKCLILTGSCDKICNGKMLGSIAKFGNLTKLELCAPWCLLTMFLDNADHLEVLTFFEDHPDSEHWRDPVEGRLLHSLRTVRIYDFTCTEPGFDMVRYILRDAQVLERMEIYCPRYGVDLNEKFDAIRKISLFCRESKKCELDFS